MYLAIIGDIIDSRDIENRESLQEKYKNVFSKINEQYSNQIVSYFKIRDGDGFHGLLNSPDELLDIILKIRLAIVPYQVRIGIGIGDISTKIDKFNVQNIDGSAYSTARDALDFLSENEKKYESFYRTTMIKVYDKLNINKNDRRVLETYENLINTVLCACSQIEKGWDKIHAETILMRMNSMTQRQMADELGISQGAVSKRIASLSNYYTYEYYSSSVKAAIKELWENILHV